MAEVRASKAGSGKTLKTLAGVGLVGVAGAVAAASASESSSPEPDVPFDVDSGRLTITVEGKVASDLTLGLPFHFEP